jgi:hypothetical protein
MIAQNLPLLTVAGTAPRCIGIQKREIVFRGEPHAHCAESFLITNLHVFG